MTVRATNKVSGVTVTADEAVIRRLGPGWEPEKPEAKKPPARRSRKGTDGDE